MKFRRQQKFDPIVLKVLTLLRNIKTFTVWPEPIWIKVSGWWQIPPQHQITYLGGPESASIEIPPFRPFLWSKFSKIKYFKKFRIAPNFFFCFTIHKKLNKSCSLNKIFLFLKKKIVSLKKTSSEILWSERLL